MQKSASESTWNEKQVGTYLEELHRVVNTVEGSVRKGEISRPSSTGSHNDNIVLLSNLSSIVRDTD